MKEKNKIKLIIIIICISITLVIGIFLTIRYTIKTDKITSSNLNTNYIYTEKIESIVIKYYEGYNISTGNVISDTIPLNEINIEGNDLAKLSNLISNLKKVEYSKNDEMYNHIQYDYLCDSYKLEINDKFTIYIGNEYGIVEKTNDYFKVPNELYNIVLEIAQDYNEKNLYKKINSEKISIVCDGEILEITDKEQLNELSNYKYYIINSFDEDFESEEVAYTLNLSGGRKIDIYYASVLSCIYYEDGTHEYIYTGSLENYVEKIFNNSKVKINTDNVDSIVIMYKGNKFLIDNQNKINEILKEFKNLSYNDYNYLKSMSEDDFDQNDIKIYVNNTKYIIPGNISYASRFFIDDSGKLYDVSGLYNSDIELYFKELVNYKEQN